MLDPEQAKYRDLFETLERDAAGAKSARSSGKVTGRMVGAGCAAIIAVYGAGYARTQSAADAFTKQLAVRRVAAPPLPGNEVTLDRSDIAHPQVETVTVPAGKPAGRVREGVREPAKVNEPGLGRLDKTESQTQTQAPPESTAATAAAPVSAAPHDSLPSTPAAPAFAPPPVIERQADPPTPAKLADAAPAPPPAAHWKDGTYTGWGYSRHGNIEAQVVIESGRIASATISQCRTRYSCSVIDRLPPEVAQRQSPEVDWVSGATQSADAFYGAVVEALGKAK
jgi:uncharacterized protein with FMN-binding domain